MADKFCTKCGAMINGDEKFCTSCGAPVEAAAAPAAAVAAAVPAAAPMEPWPPKGGTAPVYGTPAKPAENADAPAKGSPYAPISTGGFVGIILLGVVPIVNLIFLIVWACGGCTKINKRNFARATLIVAAIGVIVSVALGILFATLLSSDMVEEIVNEFQYSM